MFLKIIGALVVLAASSIIGYVYSKDCSKRPEELRVLQGLLQMFENEISFLSNVLIDAFRKICASNDSSATIFFKGTIDCLEKNSGVNATEAWETAVRNNLHFTSLKEEDARILLSFGKMLGNSDLEGQIKNIRLTLSQLKIQEQKAEESRKKNESMYKNLGILCGMALVILLI